MGWGGGLKNYTWHADRNLWRYTESGGETELTGGGTVPLVGETVQEEALGDKSGERGEVSATGERAEQTSFRRFAWTTSQKEVLGSRTLNLLPYSLAVTRKRPINFWASLQDRSEERFMTESPTSRVIGVACKCCLWVLSSLEAFSFSRTEAWMVGKLWSCNLE